MRFKHAYRDLGPGLLACLLITACSNSGQPSADLRAYAANSTPDNPELAAIYQRSCQACHAGSTPDAPMTGDAEAWQERQRKGMDTLITSVVSGMGGMPPYGLCMDCDTGEFRSLIAFMATPPGQQD